MGWGARRGYGYGLGGGGVDPILSPFSPVITPDPGSGGAGGSGGGFVEETIRWSKQLAENYGLVLVGTDRGGGQKLTIPGRWVKLLYFKLYKQAAGADGTITFYIRKVSDDSVIASKEWGPVNNLITDPTLQHVEFDPPVYVNGEVRILAEFVSATSSALGFRMYTSSVRPGEELTHYSVVLGTRIYTDNPSWDMTYAYGYLPN